MKKIVDKMVVEAVKYQAENGIMPLREISATSDGFLDPLTQDQQ